jgi:hypothetical protein
MGKLLAIARLSKFKIAVSQGAAPIDALENKITPAPKTKIPNRYTRRNFILIE